MLSEKLRQVIGLIDKPWKWIKGEVEGGAHRERHCIMGAIDQVTTSREYNLLTKAIFKEIQDQYKEIADQYISVPAFTEYTSIPAFNDHEKTRHKDVMALLNRVLEKVEATEMWQELKRRTKRVPSPKTKEKVLVETK